MSKFKLGDRVRVVKQRHSLSDTTTKYLIGVKGGVTAITTCIGSTVYFLDDNRYETNFLEEDLELISTEFHTGDRVRLIESYLKNGVPIWFHRDFVAALAGKGELTIGSCSKYDWGQGDCLVVAIESPMLAYRGYYPAFLFEKCNVKAEQPVQPSSVFKAASPVLDKLAEYKKKFIGKALSPIEGAKNKWTQYMRDNIGYIEFSNIGRGDEFAICCDINKTEPSGEYIASFEGSVYEYPVELLQLYESRPVSKEPITSNEVHPAIRQRWEGKRVDRDKAFLEGSYSLSHPIWEPIGYVSFETLTNMSGGVIICEEVYRRDGYYYGRMRYFGHYPLLLLKIYDGLEETKEEPLEFHSPITIPILEKPKIRIETLSF